MCNDAGERFRERTGQAVVDGEDSEDGKPVAIVGDRGRMDQAASSGNRRLILVATLLATFLTAMESTVVSTAMPTIIGELHGLNLYAWVFSAYLLASTATVPLYGRLADMLGRKPVFLAGIGLFLLGSSSRRSSSPSWATSTPSGSARASRGSSAPSGARRAWAGRRSAR